METLIGILIAFFAIIGAFVLFALMSVAQKTDDRNERISKILNHEKDK